MSKKLKKRLVRILAGGAAFAAAVILPELLGLGLNVTLALFLLAYFIVGGDVLQRAVKNLCSGMIFDENFLMAIATIGAFLVGEYPEGVAVMLFYQIGEWFQSYAVNQSRKSIAGLMDIRPDYANIKKENGELEEVDPDLVEIGAVIVVKPGERIPLDGTVIKGISSLDTMALTGEALPREAGAGDTVLSGCINVSGVLEIQVEKEFGESTVSKILDLVENASSKKAEAENFITKFAKYYTPAVVICAVLLAVLPPLILQDGSFSKWIYRALTFLVISCPCALVISIPLSFFGGIGGASKNGILIKGSNYLEALAQAEIAVFDKTGTLTKGTFQVTEIYAEGMEKEMLLELAAYAESFSNHPISLSLKNAYGKQIDNSRIRHVEEISGHGVKAVIDEKKVCFGNRRMMETLQTAVMEPENIGTVVYAVIDGKYAGYIIISDEIKSDAKQAVADLKAAGMKQLVMLTGDRKEVGQAVAKELGMTKTYTELLPADKVKHMEELLQEKTEKGKLIFVGDGINDAPVLARADIGIAMGGLGSDAAIEAADIVIMTDEPSKISQAIRISKKTLSIVRQNIVFALGVKILVLLLAAFGWANMWAAVFADVGVSVIAIINAMRALKCR